MATLEDEHEEQPGEDLLVGEGLLVEPWQMVSCMKQNRREGCSWSQSRSHARTARPSAPLREAKRSWKRARTSRQRW